MSESDFKVTPRKTAVDTAVEIFDVVFGPNRRKVSVRKLNLGDQYDISEIAGNNAGNQLWLSMTLAAAAVTDIDGWPTPPGQVSKQKCRDVLAKLGEDGLRAVTMALNQASANEGKTADEIESEHRDAVKN